MNQSSDTMEIDKFMASALVTWFSSCLNSTAFSGEKLTYDDIVDGFLLYNVYLQMNPHEEDNDVRLSYNDVSQRQRNLTKVFDNLRQFYEEELGQVLLLVPDLEQLAREPELNVSEAKLLLCLLLGYAVQCKNKEKFIIEMNSLDELTQDDIKKYIQQVVYIPGIVLTCDMLTATIELDPSTDETFEPSDKQKAFERLQQIYIERNELRDKSNNTFMNNSLFTKLDRTMDFEDDQIDDLKAKLRVQRLKFKEMESNMMELKDALKDSEIEIDTLKTENIKLGAEVRSLRIKTKDCNDELDAVRDKVEKTERLEQEILRYKEKLCDMENYKSHIDELNQLNLLLNENKEELQNQVITYKIKTEKVNKLEEQIFQLSQRVNELTLEDAAWKEKCQKFEKKNEELEIQLKASNKFYNSITDLDDIPESFSMVNNSLSEQLTSREHSLNSQKTLELELENRRLSSAVDALKEKSFLESSSTILNLEKDKKKLAITVDTLKEDLRKLQLKNGDLEEIYKKIVDENKRLQKIDSQELSFKLAELEKKHASLLKEKNELEGMIDIHSSLKRKNKKASKDEINDVRINQRKLQKNIETLEAEKKTYMKEIERQKKLVEEKSAEVDAATMVIDKLEKKMEKLEEQAEKSIAEVVELTDIVDKLNSSTQSNDTDTIKLKKMPKKNIIEAAEIQNLQVDSTQLAAEVKILKKSRNKMYSNQQHLKLLYEQLQKDNQIVLKERRGLQKQVRDVKTKIRMQADYIHRLEQEINSLRTNNGSCSNNVGQEYLKLKDDFGRLMTEYTKATTQTNRLSLSYADHRKEVDEKNLKIIEMESYTSMIDEKCNMLVQMNKQLTDEKKSLIDDISELIKNYRELFLQTIEDNKQYYIEDRKNNERLNNLKGLKERLEAKLIDQIIKSNNPSKKKTPSSNIVKTTFSRVKRAGSEFFGRSRKTSAEDTSSASERSYDFEFQKGAESDLSLEYKTVRSPGDCCVSNLGDAVNKPRNRKSIDFLENFCPDNFSFSDKISCSEPNSRLSINASGLIIHSNNNDEDELDRTLKYESFNTDKNSDVKEVDTSMFSKKSIDLSFEEKDIENEGDSVKDKENSEEFSSRDLLSSSATIESCSRYSEYDCGCA